jgi:hypothetical protein
MTAQEATRDPFEHAANIERMLRGVRNHVSDDIERVDDVRALVLFETACRVLDGLIGAFEQFSQTSGVIRDGLPDSPG